MSDEIKLRSGNYYIRYGFVYSYCNKKFTRLWDGQQFDDLSGDLKQITKQEAMKLAKERF